MNLYSADSGSKQISTEQTRLQITSFTHDGSGHTEMFWLHFSIVEGSGDRLSIFLQSMVEANDLTSLLLKSCNQSSLMLN